MDVFCTKCGEPWDVGEFAADGVKVSDFRKEGCRAFGTKCSARVDEVKATVSAIALELLGEDLDGAAAVLDGEE